MYKAGSHIDWSPMPQHKLSKLIRRHAIARALQLAICLVMLCWIQLIGTSSGVAQSQSPSIDVIQERITRLNETDAEIRRTLELMVSKQSAMEHQIQENQRRTDSIYSVGTTLMVLLTLVTGYASVTGKKIRAEAENAHPK